MYHQNINLLDTVSPGTTVTSKAQQEKRRAHKKTKQSNAKADCDRYRRVKNESKYECMTAFNNYINYMVSEGNSNKKFQSFIKGKKSDNSGIAPLRDEGTLHSTPSEQAEILNRQFSSIFNTENSNSVKQHHTLRSQRIVYRNNLLLKGLSPHKASQWTRQNINHVPEDYSGSNQSNFKLLFQSNMT